MIEGSYTTLVDVVIDSGQLIVNGTLVSLTPAPDGIHRFGVVQGKIRGDGQEWHVIDRATKKRVRRVTTVTDVPNKARALAVKAALGCLGPYRHISPSTIGSAL